MSLAPPHVEVADPLRSPGDAPAAAGTSPRVLRLSVDDYEAMITANILAEDQHLELLHGQIVEKMPTGTVHGYAVNKLYKLCLRRVGEVRDLQSESAVALGSDSLPEPDLWISSLPPDSFRERRPVPSELLLLVEVADSSLQHDRTTKLALYAQAAVPEYWIVNLRDDELERHRDPRPDGTYATKRVYAAGETLDSELLGAVEVSGIVE